MPTLLAAAIDDGLMTANPAARLSRQLKLQPRRASQQEAVKAMTREQLARFFAQADRDRVARPYRPLFLTLARTGMRIGEGLALEWPNVDLAGAARSGLPGRCPAGGSEPPRAAMGAPWT